MHDDAGADGAPHQPVARIETLKGAASILLSGVSEDRVVRMPRMMMMMPSPLPLCPSAPLPL